MTTRRTPLARPARLKITNEAVEAFRAMQAATTDDERRAAHSQLHRKLGLSPWQWPAIAAPDTKCSHPPGSAAARWWPEAIKLYEELKKAQP